jgi:hypothetical protein
VTQQDVHLFVFDSLSDWEPGFAVAGINNPQFQLNPGRYRIRTVALRRGSISTMGGIRIEHSLHRIADRPLRPVKLDVMRQ